jgi:type VI secretion system VgrG family protein
MGTDELSLEFETTSSLLDPSTTRVQRVHGVDELGRCYRYAIDLEVDVDGGLADEVLDDLLKHPGRVYFGPAQDRAFLHGILASITVRNTPQPRPVLYRLELVPKLWLLGQTQRSRVFQELDLPGVLRLVLTELGFVEDEDFAIQLTGGYPVSEYTVQYQESDLAFLSRLLEHFGATFFFAQDEGRERVVFSDTNANFVQVPGYERVPYTPGVAPDLVGVTELERTVTPRPAGVLLRDYNWRTPSIALQAEAPADARTGRGFFNEYGQHFKDPGAGASLAALRAEELLATRDVYRGASGIPALSPGHQLELTGHPLPDHDRAYAVTRVEMEVVGAVEAGGSNSFEKRFVAIPLETVFRPPRRTPKPKIEGIMHGFIDGAVPGTAAPIDEYGRYKVLFPFDLAGQGGGRASRWVRLAQASSGAGYGIHFPLHIGVEVAVAHLDGDPDRPVIMNSPPNAETVTPVNATNPTQSEIVTKTGIRITWDDDA